MRVNAFGRELELQRRDDCWRVFDLGNEGKKRPAHDIVIPLTVSEGQVLEYLADLLHEYASARYPGVSLVD